VNQAEMETTRQSALQFLEPKSMNLTSFSSTRWDAQVDAVSIIHTAKMHAHPQSALGLMSMGGNGPEVLSTFSSDFGKILSGLHRTKIHGNPHFSSSIQVAGVRLETMTFSE
jgi:26S proteasome regulatory subunit N10